jgi:Cu2+-exporting ATPase
VTCCLPPPEFVEAVAGPSQPGPSDDEVRLASRSLGNGLRQSDFSVPDVHCGACVRSIEMAVGGLAGVEAARVNLSTRRLAVRWREAEGQPPIVATLFKLGYPATLDDFATERGDPMLAGLVKALAVAAFSAMNVMMLSGSVWAGADPATRDLLHWICAVLTLPVLLYSARIFYISAWRALRHGRTNMDVPISIGVLLAFALSLYDTLTRGEHAYYDATATLVFFLLIGRTLDHVMRERARTAVKGLGRLAARGALVRRDDGSRDYVPVADIVPGMTLLIAAGERVPVDAEVTAGRSDLDRAIVTGESAPQPVMPGARIEAGTLNLTGPLTVVARAAERDSFLAEMARLMEAAEGGRARYRRLADRVAAIYAPVVHLAALFTFIGWMVAAGDLHRAVVIAIAVLIITCPCALGLAVPMVQVMAARRLFERGVMIKDGGALERLESVDTVVFDKTGTLTTGTPTLTNLREVPLDLLAIAGAIAAHSRHPHALAIATAAAAMPAPVAATVAEQPGLGIEATLAGSTWRLGRAEWALAAPGDTRGTVLARDGVLAVGFAFEDTLRPGAAEAVETLLRQGLEVEIVSGDGAAAVEDVARRLGITRWAAGLMPGGKTARLAALASQGRHALMVGDGLNDAPALAAAHASMAPANAADVGRQAADVVFLRQGLGAVPETLRLARAAGRLVRQNLVLALAYNVIAIPVAVLGYATPFVAAIAMSASSVVVVANALRLGWRGPRRPDAPALGLSTLRQGVAE